MVVVMTTTSPRHGSATRHALMDAAEALFAEHGVQGATTREIVEVAEQRNVSAVTYHFGSRENLLLAVLARRGAPIDLERGELRSRLGLSPSTAELMGCLVEPYTRALRTAGGRSYLRIVAQLRGRFAGWRVDSDEGTTRNLSRIMGELEGRAPGPPEVREAHMVAMIMLMTGLTAERALAIDRDRPVPLGTDRFRDQLVRMCTAVITC